MQLVWNDVLEIVIRSWPTLKDSLHQRTTKIDDAYPLYPFQSTHEATMGELWQFGKHEKLICTTGTCIEVLAAAAAKGLC